MYIAFCSEREEWRRQILQSDAQDWTFVGLLFFLVQLATYLSLIFLKKHTAKGCSKACNMISDLTIVVTKAWKTTLGLLTIGAGRESQLRAWILFQNLAHTWAFHKWFSWLLKVLKKISWTVRKGERFIFVRICIKACKAVSSSVC